MRHVRDVWIRVQVWRLVPAGDLSDQFLKLYAQVSGSDADDFRKLLTSMIRDPEKFHAFQRDLENSSQFYTELLNGKERLFKAWEKVNAGGLIDFSKNPGFLKTLEKVAKYQDEALAGSTGTVKYYRVQTEHPDSKILFVEPNGNLKFTKPDANLNISTTTREHADYFILHSRPDGKIIEFEVPKSFDIQMKTAAIPQASSTKNLLNPDKTAPKIVDPLQPGDPFELPAYWSRLLQQNYVQGSAKIVN